MEGVASGYAFARTQGEIASLQVEQSQRVARCTWERYRGAAVVPRWQCRRGMGCGRRAQRGKAATKEDGGWRIEDGRSRLRVCFCAHTRRNGVFASRAISAGCSMHMGALPGCRHSATLAVPSGHGVWEEGTARQSRNQRGWRMEDPPEDWRTPPRPSPAGTDPVPLKAPIHDQHGENEHAIQATVANELTHGLDGLQLRVNESFHRHILNNFNQCLIAGHIPLNSENWPIFGRICAEIRGFQRYNGWDQPRR